MFKFGSSCLCSKYLTNLFSLWFPQPQVDLLNHLSRSSKYIPVFGFQTQIQNAKKLVCKFAGVAIWRGGGRVVFQVGKATPPARGLQVHLPSARQQEEDENLGSSI